MVFTGREIVMNRKVLEISVSKLKLEVSRKDYDDHSPDNLGVPQLPSAVASTSANDHELHDCTFSYYVAKRVRSVASSWSWLPASQDDRSQPFLLSKIAEI